MLVQLRLELTCHSAAILPIISYLFNQNKTFCQTKTFCQICLLVTGASDTEAGPKEIPDLTAAGETRGADLLTDQDHQDLMIVQDSINLKVKG